MHKGCDMVNDYVITHELYHTTVKRSNFLLTSWKGGLGALESDEYIFKYPTETTKAYKIRKKRALIYNYFRPITLFYTNAIYRQPISRPVATRHEIYKRFIESANMRGDSLNKIIKKISVLSTFLRIGVLVDAEVMTDNDGNPVTTMEAQEKYANRLFPFVTIIYPENLLNWHYDKRGLAWVIIKEIVTDKTDPLAKHKKVVRFILYTREYTRTGLTVSKMSSVPVYNSATKRTTTGGIVWDEPVPHNMGEVPLKMMYQHDIDEDGQWESTIEEIAMSQRRISNWMSNVDENIWNTCHSGIAVPIGDHWETIKAELQRETAGKKIIPYEAGSAPPEFLRDNLINIPMILNAVKTEVDQLYSAAGLAMQNQEAFFNQSGVAKEYDFYQFYSILSNKATSLEELENWIFGMISKYENIDYVPEKDSVKYSRNYDITDDIKLMERDMDVISARICPALTQYAEEQYTVHAYPDLPTDDPDRYRDIISQIEALHTKKPFGDAMYTEFKELVKLTGDDLGEAFKLFMDKYGVNNNEETS